MRSTPCRYSFAGASIPVLKKTVFLNSHYDHLSCLIIFSIYSFAMAEIDPEDSGAFARLHLTGDLPSFDIDLYPTGDEESGFHTQNDPLEPYQRTNVIQRRGAVDVRCSLIDVVHGRFNDSACGTLLVLQFRFDPRKRARRIASADISLTFASMKSGGPRPEVYAISLDGKFSMVQTSQHEEVTQGGDVNLGASSVPAFRADGGLKWEKKTNADISDATTVVGSIDLFEFGYGPNNCASWSLMENGTRKTGVPASMRVGLLLKRKTQDLFRCTVEIKAKADWGTRWENLFGFKPKDDPVLFNPELKSTNNLMKYQTENLSAFDLESVSDLTFTTMRGGVIKES